MTFSLQSVVVKLVGMWFLCDAIFSLALYIGNPNEKWLRNHLVRLIRLVAGTLLILVG